MGQSSQLKVKLIVLGIIGLFAYMIDGWAKDNTSLFLLFTEGGLLVLLMSTDINEMFKGNLKAGPERIARSKAIEMLSFQVILAAYLMALSILALYSANSGYINNYINSPFLIWLVFMPLLVIAFILEFRVDSNEKKT